MAEIASDEGKEILTRFSSDLVNVVAISLRPGNTSHRTTCPDGQFWLPVRGEQVVWGSNGSRRQRPFELLYYAPKEPAVRMADSSTLAYGLQVKLSKMSEEERDGSWLAASGPSWDLMRPVLSLILGGLASDADPHTLDEAVARWVATPSKGSKETARARWLRQVEELLYDDPSLTLLDLSRAVGIVPAYLSAEFSRTQGQTISSYRRQIMLQRALTSVGQSNLNEAAIEAGFYDASHFHRACVAELNVKPSSLRRLIQRT